MFEDPSGAEWEIKLGGSKRVSVSDAERQTRTAREILHRLDGQPGVVLADEVGMGKTFVALAVAASAILDTWKQRRPVIVTVPRGLVEKWLRDWADFRRHCVPAASRLRFVEPAVAKRPMELFRLFEQSGTDRARLIVTSVSAYTGKLTDPWIKLLLVRLGLMHMTVSKDQRENLEFWLTILLRKTVGHSLSRSEIVSLLRASRAQWPNILASAGVTPDDAALLEKFWKRAEDLDWWPFANFMNDHLLSRYGVHGADQVREVRRQFDDALQQMFREWRSKASWSSPLLILDEAHHAKNDRTRLARLFRDPETSAGTGGEAPALANKFDRILLLTATPFQLGHQELIRILLRLGAIRWGGRRSPEGDERTFRDRVEDLRDMLDRNRAATHCLQRLWGQIEPALPALRTGHSAAEGRSSEVLSDWLARFVEPETVEDQLPSEMALGRALADCKRTKQLAETALRPWIIRHNKPTLLSEASEGSRELLRRLPIRGAGIISAGQEHQSLQPGLAIEGDDLLAFLLAARAQGESAALKRKQLLQFAGGLCSSYEAFHHTRGNSNVSETIDGSDGLVGGDAEFAGVSSAASLEGYSESRLRWYADQIARHVPGKDPTSDLRTVRHPKLSAVIARVVDLWEAGEKALIFCFYRQTSSALRDHIAQAVRERIAALAVARTGLADPRRATSLLESIGRRLGDKRSPFYHGLNEHLRKLVSEEIATTSVPPDVCERLIALFLAYSRSVPFLVRSLPPNDPEFYQLLTAESVTAAKRERAVETLLRAIDEGRGGRSSASGRFREFVRFVLEAGGSDGALDPSVEEAARVESDEGDELESEMHEQRSVWSTVLGDLAAVADFRSSGRDGVRARNVVSMVNGETPVEERYRVARAFNGPLFPEIMISSSVLGEGIDLHRFCRHVVHHDLDWNPSRLEQRTGRVDRIRCLAERERASIRVYEPYIAGSADERMFRVVQDRQRWFQVVMGQRYDLTDASAEEVVERLPLPERLAHDLTFQLSV